jgi:hypothetical protein
MDAKTRPTTAGALTDRIIFIVNGVELPTLQLCFTEPLKGVPGLKTELISEVELNGGPQDPEAWRTTAEGVEKLRRRLETFQPTLMVFCRYSGPYAPEMIEWARTTRTPTIYHIDDDLLRVPAEIGERKPVGITSRGVSRRCATCLTIQLSPIVPTKDSAASCSARPPPNES